MVYVSQISDKLRLLNVEPEEVIARSLALFGGSGPNPNATDLIANF